LTIRDLLASCYRNSLALAREHGVKTIAFPAIICGVHHYPLEQAVAIAIRETSAFVTADDCIDKIIFACFGLGITGRLHAGTRAPVGCAGKERVSQCADCRA
jgi:O-acetyl-ADP-ribose deacetylase (regulator of RNase III)